MKQSKFRGVAFVGFGSLGKQIFGMLDEELKKKQTAYFDDVLYKTAAKDSYPFADFASDSFKDGIFIVGLGYKNPKIKAETLTTLTNLRREIGSVISPSANISKTATLSPGVIIYPMCNVDQETNIGSGVVLNNSVVVSHNCVIEDCAYLSPGVVLSGNVVIGRGTFLGSGSVVANGVKIGENVTVGIGSVVTSNVPAGVSIIGNPARILDEQLRLE